MRQSYWSSHGTLAPPTSIQASAVLATLEQAGVGLTLPMLADRMGCELESVYMALKRLLAVGKVVRSGDGVLESPHLYALPGHS
jgi:DNA-binding IclR family transcriptional regulator